MKSFRNTAFKLRPVKGPALPVNGSTFIFRALQAELIVSEFEVEMNENSCEAKRWQIPRSNGRHGVMLRH